jgi:hypothetical protein
MLGEGCGGADFRDEWIGEQGLALTLTGAGLARLEIGYRDRRSGGHHAPGRGVRLEVALRLRPAGLSHDARGPGHLSERARPIVYMVHAYPWFFDDVNHINRIFLVMVFEMSIRPLLIRAFSYATHARWHEAGTTDHADLTRLDATIRASAI